MANVYPKNRPLVKIIRINIRSLHISIVTVCFDAHFFISLSGIDKGGVLSSTNSMRKLISFLFFIFTLHLAVVGQQDPQFTNNAFYKLGINPGFAGSNDAINGILLNRYQWAGFGEGAPKTLVFSAEGAIKSFGSPGGIGINIISDELGYEKNSWVSLAYAYKIGLSFGTLGIGLSAGVYSKSINGEWYIPEYNGVYGSTSDPGIPQGEVSQMAFDIGLGLYLKANNYFAGASVTHVNQAAILFDGEASTYMTRHYYLSGGYNIKLPDPLFELRSLFLFKTDIASWQIDLNATVFYNEKYWGGLNYRYQDAISLLFGIELFNGMTLGYAFDLTTSAIGRYGYGSHEIFIGYSFELERKRTRKYKSIRFL